MSVWEIVSSVFILTGVSFALLGAIGVNRFDNVFARMHAQTKPVTLGLLLIATGTMFQLDNVGDMAKLGLAVFLQFVTAPLGMHLLGRSAYSNRFYTSPPPELDELAAAEAEEQV